jgi:putative two-component system response regulator
MSRKKLLAVDDNPMNLEILTEMLSEDYEVVCATDGAKAVKLAQRHRPAVVLLDIMLPGADGYEICRRLRAMPDVSEARIIMVSAKAMPSELAQGYAAGADGYVTKPFDEQDLLDAIRTTAAEKNPSVSLYG